MYRAFCRGLRTFGTVHYRVSKIRHQPGGGGRNGLALRVGIKLWPGRVFGMDTPESLPYHKP